MLRNVLSVFLATLSLSAVAETYTVECPSTFPTCSNFITEKLNKNFLVNYPKESWKIVIPKYYIGIMGNGSLKSYFSIAVVPVDSDISTKSMEEKYESKKPRKIYSAFKTGGDILALKNQELDFQHINMMFDKSKALRAQEILEPIMASEASNNMMEECNKSPSCDLYAP